MKQDEIEIERVPEIVADTTRVCEIRFDCLVTMHDVGYRKHQGYLSQNKVSKTPQWFRAQHKLTLEAVRHSDPCELGMRIKQMFQQMEYEIRKYEDL